MQIEGYQMVSERGAWVEDMAIVVGMMSSPQLLQLPPQCNGSSSVIAYFLSVPAPLSAHLVVGECSCGGD